MVNNARSDPLWELTHREVCSILSIAYTELFEQIERRKYNISLRIRNYLQGILPNQFVIPIAVLAMKLSSGHDWYSVDVKKSSREKTAVWLE